jgi:hypothetical protein
MWGWLKAIMSAFFDALFSLFWKEVNKPDTIEDEKTPTNVKRDWNRYVADQLRDKNGGH